MHTSDAMVYELFWMTVILLMLLVAYTLGAATGRSFNKQSIHNVNKPSNCAPCENATETPVVHCATPIVAHVGRKPSIAGEMDVSQFFKKC